MSGQTTLKRTLQIVGVVVVAVAVVVLAALAYVHANPPVVGAGQTPGYQAQSLGEEIDEAAVPGSEDEVVAAPQTPAAGTSVASTARLLTALGGTSLVRATTGPCPETLAALSTSLDGGATWADETLSDFLPLVALSRLADLGDGAFVALGSNPTDCGQRVAFSTPTAEATWNEYPAGNLWQVDPGDTAVVITSTGMRTSPGCAVARLEVGVDGRVAVLCQDTSVATSFDEGQTWTRGGTFPGADALAVTATGVLVGAVGVPGCEGVEVTSLDPLLNPAGSVCVAATAAAGQTAIAAAPDGPVWMWAGEVIRRSDDGGTTWR